MTIASLLSVIVFGMHEAPPPPQEIADRPLRVVPEVDLRRYAGTWYEIARLPNRFQEEGSTDVTATYTLLADGEIEVVNRCRTSSGELKEVQGRARRAGEEEPQAKLKVRFAPAILSFLPWVWGNYWIIELDAGYRYAVIGEPDRNYFWVLARTPRLEESLLSEILERARSQGYRLDGLLRTSHPGAAPDDGASGSR